MFNSGGNNFFIPLSDMDNIKMNAGCVKHVTWEHFPATRTIGWLHDYQVI
jgi:hypothetical protein